MLSEVPETQQTRPADQDGPGAIDARLVSAALALPIVVAVGLHAMVIVNFLVDHAQAILTWTGVALTVMGGMGCLGFLMELFGLSERREYFSDEESAGEALFVAAIFTLMTSGGIVLLLRGSIWDATGAVTTTAGIMAIVTGLAIIWDDDPPERNRKIPPMSRKGQLSVIYGAVLASIGIVILCRSQLG